MKARALDLTKSADRAFAHLLVNTLLVSVIDFTMWFAVTFWVYLETKSVLATGMVSGIFLITTAASEIWFGSLVDQQSQKDHDASLSRGLAGFLCRCFYPLPANARADIRRAIQPHTVGLHRGDHDGRDHGEYPLDRPVDAGDGVDPGRSQDKANGLVGTTTGACCGVR